MKVLLRHRITGKHLQFQDILTSYRSIIDDKYDNLPELDSNKRYRRIPVSN